MSPSNPFQVSAFERSDHSGFDRRSHQPSVFHPLAFVVFVFLAAPLVRMGLLIYLFSLVLVAALRGEP